MTETVRRHNEPFLPQIFTGKIRNRHRLKEPLSEKPLQILSKQDLLCVRKSLKQNLCVEMLQEGCHRSFSKFFHVLRLDQDRRDSCKPSLADRLPPPLEHQRDKMETMKQHLTQAEKLERSGTWSVACEQYLSLGLYFSSPEDLWLRLHFLHVCADHEHGSGSRAATEACFHLAEIYLQQGKLEKAKQQAQRCLQQAEDGCWLDTSGFPLKLRACHSLWGIYDGLADAPLSSGHYSRALTLLHQASTMATESGDKRIEGEAANRLGVAYQRSGDHMTAKKYLNSYMEMCQELQDVSGLGKAYKAVAKALESEGKMEERVQCLLKLTELSGNGGLQYDLVDACLCLGEIYYNKREFDQACVFYLKGYKSAIKLGDITLLQKTQVMLGRAKALSMMTRQYSADVVSASRSSLQRLIAWKDTRTDDTNQK